MDDLVDNFFLKSVKTIYIKGHLRSFVGDLRDAYINCEIYRFALYDWDHDVLRLERRLKIAVASP